MDKCTFIMYVCMYVCMYVSMYVCAWILNEYLSMGVEIESPKEHNNNKRNCPLRLKMKSY